jgi:glucose-1-phosphate thymidylyltransferase
MGTFCTIILAGGYGSRLGEIGFHTAKPLLPLGRRRIIDYVVDKVCEIDNNSAVFVLVNSRFLDQFQQWVQTQQHAARLTLVNNQQAAEFVAPDIITNIVRTLEHQGISSDLLIVGGDNFFEFSLAGFLAFGRQHGISTVVVDVGSRRDAERFSVVRLGEDGRIIELVEKPKSPSSTLVTTCLFWFPATALGLFEEYVRTGGAVASFGQFTQWLAGRAPIHGFLAEGAWRDVGTLDTYRTLQLQFAQEPTNTGETQA